MWGTLSARRVWTVQVDDDGLSVGREQLRLADIDVDHLSAVDSGVDASHPDRAFYAGKRASALYFVRNVLPGVAQKAQVIAGEDSTALDIPDEAFVPG